MNLRIYRKTQKSIKKIRTLFRLYGTKTYQPWKTLNVMYIYDHCGHPRAFSLTKNNWLDAHCVQCFMIKHGHRSVNWEERFPAHKELVGRIEG